VVAVLTACGSRDLKVAEPISFSAIEQYSLQPKCVQCHSTLATYEGVMSSNIVVPGSPEKSQLYRQVQSGDMPQQSTGLSTGEIQTIYEWIQQGAPNN
jgi:uncharacterized membrane protein